jgi:hypothetical protein
MKKFLGVAIFALVVGMPAYAQQRGNGSGFGGGSSNGPQANNGGGGMGGAISAVGGNTNLLPHYAMLSTGTAAASGNDTDFVPSGYLPYDNAIEKGKLALDAKTKPLGQIAHENEQVTHPKAKMRMVQDINGNAVLVLQ